MPMLCVACARVPPKYDTSLREYSDTDKTTLALLFFKLEKKDLCVCVFVVAKTYRSVQHNSGDEPLSFCHIYLSQAFLSLFVVYIVKNGAICCARFTVSQKKKSTQDTTRNEAHQDATSVTRPTFSCICFHAITIF
uniref:Uncharacterized protein n=1 Tax=Ditylum brightwellii TaxID=49249 RepID=A0A7S4S2L0_9STRA